MPVTLWDTFATNFDEEDISKKGATHSIIIILAAMTVRTFKEEMCANRKSIAELLSLDLTDSENAKFTCEATIAEIDTSYGWWYKACHNCKTAVKTCDDTFWCSRCNSSEQSPIPWYRLSTIVEDGSGIANFTILAEEVSERKEREKGNKGNNNNNGSGADGGGGEPPRGGDGRAARVGVGAARIARTFALITLTLIFPLSFAVLAHSLFTTPSSCTSSALRLPPLPLHLLPPLHRRRRLHGRLPLRRQAGLLRLHPLRRAPIFPRLFRTFLWVSLLMLLYNVAFGLSVLLLLLLSDARSAASLLLLAAVVVAFLAATSTSPPSGTSPASSPSSSPSAASPPWPRAASSSAAAPASPPYSSRPTSPPAASSRASFAPPSSSTPMKRAASGSAPGQGPRRRALVALLVLLNLLGLLVQSIFYYVCKSFHRQPIDKTALFDHLGGYLGEYVPLKSSIQMENLS
uniref:Replication factor A C-terminal domain-containing protein n=1 Tax=Ananas comosus var. bracteatus TaxID=296719 RepID=A0A6V7QBF4_ANACO|nr:unnamed protein product [Ananas comosus var. bracteatus]